jgi:serine/threonine protein kinase
MAATPDSTAQPRVIGDFRLERLLGKGGMGEVWLAHQVSLDRKAAVKLLAKHLADKPDFVKRFYREARAMAKIDHPQAVRVYAVDEADGVHFVAMELIDGKSLQDWLDKLGKLSVGDALHVTLRCAEALAHAHSMQMIHRDIKPDNIMITSKGVVKVADFGLAKALDDEEMSMTQSGTGLGTPYYMAPEQARNAKHVDGRCDIYALGATLYHLLTGALPFKADSLIELIKLKDTGKFPPARKTSPEVPERLDLILDKMLAPNPDQRFKDFHEVIRLLNGLGLASPSLSFITAADKVVVATGTPAAAPKLTPPASKSSANAPGAKTAAPGGTSKAAGAKTAAGTETVWFIQFKTAEGKDTIARWTTPQILQALRTGTIDAKAKLKQQASDSFLPIAQFREFEQAVQGLLIKQKADKKAGDMKALYAQIDHQEKWRKTTRKIQAIFSGALGFISLIVYLALIGGVLAGAYFGWQYYSGKIASSVGLTGDKPAGAKSTTVPGSEQPKP